MLVRLWTLWVILIAVIAIVNCTQCPRNSVFEFIENLSATVGFLHFLLVTFLLEKESQVWKLIVKECLESPKLCGYSILKNQNIVGLFCELECILCHNNSFSLILFLSQFSLNYECYVFIHHGKRILQKVNAGVWGKSSCQGDFLGLAFCQTFLINDRVNALFSIEVYLKSEFFVKYFCLPTSLFIFMPFCLLFLWAFFHENYVLKNWWFSNKVRVERRRLLTIYKNCTLNLFHLSKQHS